MLIDNRVLVITGVVIFHARRLAAVVMVKLHRVEAAPAKQGRVGVHVALDGFPTAGLQVHVDAHRLEHRTHGLGQIPAGGIAAGVPQGDFSRQAIFLTDTVGIFNPAGVIQQLSGLVDIAILERRIRVVPRQALHAGIGRDRVAFEDLVGEQLAVDGVVDGFANGHVGRHIVADGVAVSVFFT